MVEIETLNDDGGERVYRFKFVRSKTEDDEEYGVFDHSSLKLGCLLYLLFYPSLLCLLENYGTLFIEEFLVMSLFDTVYLALCYTHVLLN